MMVLCAFTSAILSLSGDDGGGEIVEFPTSLLFDEPQERGEGETLPLPESPWPKLGMIGGYRLIHTRAETIQSEVYLGVSGYMGRKHQELTPYFNFKFGVGIDDEAEAQRNPAFEDEWGHITLEGEGGFQWTIAESKDHRLWTSLGAQLTYIRAVQHHAGPDGEHDHYEGSHDVNVFGGGGIVARIGSAHRAREMDVEPSIGVSWVSLGGLGTGYVLDLSLNFRF